MKYFLTKINKSIDIFIKIWYNVYEERNLSIIKMGNTLCWRCSLHKQFYEGTPGCHLFLSPVFSIIYIDNKEKDYHSKCYNVIHYSNLLTPWGWKKTFSYRITPSSQRYSGKWRDAPYRCYLDNCTIVMSNSQYIIDYYFNLYIHTIVYDRD